MSTEPSTVMEIIEQRQESPRVPAAALTPMGMLQIAIERGADISVMERLLTLQERWDATQARKAFVEALTAFKATPPTLIKNKHVQYASSKGPDTEYDHATLDQVSTLIGSALSAHQLSHRWEIEQLDGGLIRVTCILTHALGHCERVSLQASADQTGGKNNIQAVGSTITYLERYSLLAATGLAAKDQDNDGGSAINRISPEQKEALIDLMKETGADTKKFLEYMKIETLDDLPATKFADAKAALERKKGAK